MDIKKKSHYAITGNTAAEIIYNMLDSEKEHIGLTNWKNSGLNIDEQLVEINKLSKRNNNATANIQDYKLSRYICYLIVQNIDSNKEVVALGQTYFAIQIRKQEITEQEYDSLSDDEKRFYQRKLTKQGNYSLQKIAVSSGVKNIIEIKVLITRL